MSKKWSDLRKFKATKRYKTSTVFEEHNEFGQNYKIYTMFDRNTGEHSKSYTLYSFNWDGSKHLENHHTDESEALFIKNPNKTTLLEL